MDMFRVFSNTSFKNTSVELICPSCGSKCQDSDEICSTCAFDLHEYKEIVLAPYKFFNDAIDLTKKELYFEALIASNKFLAFYPNDEDANKLNIYLLYMTGNIEAYQRALDDFEIKFVRNPWIMDIETKGIDAYILPSARCNSVSGNEIAFEQLAQEYVAYRTKTINDIVKLTCDFYDVIRAYNGKSVGQKLLKFFETNFYHFLSKKEISVVSHNGLIYDELSDEELETITVHDKVTDKKRPQGSILTYYPAIFLRHALVSKEIVAYVDNDIMVPTKPLISNEKKTKTKKRNPSKRRSK